MAVTFAAVVHTELPADQGAPLFQMTTPMGTFNYYLVNDAKTKAVVSGDLAAVSGNCISGSDSSETRCVVVYRIDTEGNWALVKAIPNDVTVSSWYRIDNDNLGSVFAHDIALDGTTLAVSSLKVNGVHTYGGEKVFVFNATDTSSDPVQTIDNPQSNSGLFGEAIALDGNTLVIGNKRARSSSSSWRTDYGEVTIHTRVNEASPFTTAQTIESPTTVGANGRVHFGESVDVSGDLVVVGAPYWRTTGQVAPSSGAVFVYRGASWNEVDRIETPGFLNHSRFGAEVAIDGSTILASTATTTPVARAQDGNGGVYVYTEITADNWSMDRLLQLTSDSFAEKYFGRTISIDGEYALIGANVVGSCQNSSFVSLYNTTSWARSEIDAPVPTCIDSTDPCSAFGASMDLSGELAVISAPSQFSCRAAAYEIDLSCGNGVNETGEACDDGNNDSNDGCSANCVAEYCGDGVINNGVEVCDEGSANGKNLCAYGDQTCQICDSVCLGYLEAPYCGDGVVNGPETCDFGSDTATCKACRWSPVYQTQKIEIGLPVDSIAMSDSPPLVVVGLGGGPGGAANLYELDRTTNSGWTLDKSLSSAFLSGAGASVDLYHGQVAIGSTYNADIFLASDAAWDTGSPFFRENNVQGSGYHVHLNENHLLAGCAEEWSCGGGDGFILAYHRGSATETFTQISAIDKPDVIPHIALFGNSISLAGDYFVTATNDNNWYDYKTYASGHESAAFLYHYNATASAWDLVETLVNSNYDTTLSVAMNSQFILVGDRTRVQVQVWSWNATLQEFEASDADPIRPVHVVDSSSQFPGSMSVAGNRAMIGAPGHNSSAGDVFVFELMQDGTWNETINIAAEDAASGQEFGRHVHLAQDDSLIVASKDAVYVYDLNCGDGSLGTFEICDHAEAGATLCEYGVEPCYVCEGRCRNINETAITCGDDRIQEAHDEECEPPGSDNCNEECRLESNDVVGGVNPLHVGAGAGVGTIAGAGAVLLIQKMIGGGAAAAAAPAV